MRTEKCYIPYEGKREKRGRVYASKDVYDWSSKTRDKLTPVLQFSDRRCNKIFLRYKKLEYFWLSLCSDRVVISFGEAKTRICKLFLYTSCLTIFCVCILYLRVCVIKTKMNGSSYFRSFILKFPVPLHYFYSNLQQRIPDEIAAFDRPITSE